MPVRRAMHGFVTLAFCSSLVACGSLAESGGGSGPLTARQGGDSLAAEEPARGGELVDVDGTGAAGGAGAGVTVPGERAGPGGVASGQGSAAADTGATGGGGTDGRDAPGAAAANGKSVKLGITYPDTAAIAAAFGQKSNDAAGFITKIVNYINKTGGIAGRQIEPVYFKFGVEEDHSTAGQRACTALTQDDKVDIVYNGGIGGETLPACLGQAGVSMFDGFGAFDAVGERRIRNRFAPGTMRLDRERLGVLNISAQAGRIKRGDTLGLLVEDCDWGPRVAANIIEPRAKELGLKVVRGTHRCVRNIVSDLGPVTNDVQRETLRFGSQGVTHVLFISSPEAFVLSRFTETASQQQYYPKYLVSSNAYVYQNTREGAVVKIAPDARPNVSGAGTAPFLDVGHDAKPENTQQAAARKRCLTADPDEGTTAGESNPGKKPFARNVYYGVCDGFYALKATLEASGLRYGVGDVTRGFHAALSGNRTASANLGGGFFVAAPTRLDGVAALRPFTWDAKRQQYSYVGDPAVQP